MEQNTKEMKHVNNIWDFYEKIWEMGGVGENIDETRWTVG